MRKKTDFSIDVEPYAKPKPYVDLNFSSGEINFFVRLSYSEARHIANQILSLTPDQK